MSINKFIFQEITTAIISESVISDLEYCYCEVIRVGFSDDLNGRC